MIYYQEELDYILETDKPTGQKLALLVSLFHRLNQKHEDYRKDIQSLIKSDDYILHIRIPASEVKDRAIKELEQK